jgi:hypothetical protein
MASNAICTRAKESGSFLTRTTAFKKLTKWAFSVCDSDKTGQLGKSELFAGLLLVHVNLAKYAGAAACYPPSREVVEQLFEASDDDNSGDIDEEEFTCIVVICCGQIFSRMLVYYSVFVVMAPYLAGNIVSNIDSFVLGSELPKPGLSAGTADIDIHGGKRNRISRSFRPFGHFITAIRSAVSSCVFLRALARITLRVYGRTLDIQRFILDYSLALRNGCQKVYPGCNFQLCYPHLVGHLKGSWKKMHDSENRDILMKEISMLHNVTSQDQFNSLFELVMDHWLDLGEEVFVTMFRHHYGPDSICEGKWFLLSGDFVYVLPNNNIVENYWSELKGKTPQQRLPVVCLMVNLTRFVHDEIPKLVEHDYLHRCGVKVGGNLESLGYRPLDHNILGLTALMDFKRDVHQVGENEFFVNSSVTIGRAITKGRIDAFGAQSSSPRCVADGPTNFSGALRGLCH